MQYRLISIAIALSLGLSQAASSDLPTPQVPEPALAQFKTATPESVGLDSAQLTKMLNYLQTPGFDMESIIIARHGKVVLEAYVAPFHAGIPHQVNSVTKSFMATLIGMLISDGKLKLTDTVADILPQYADLPNAKLITVEQLLGMKSGLLWNELGGWGLHENDFGELKQQDDIVKFVLNRSIEPDQVNNFNYNSGGSDLLGILGEAALGSSLADYAQQRLFKPLGITKTHWLDLDQQGRIGGGRGLYIMPRDMLKLGELHRQNGVWQGQQILPASWVQYATSPSIPVSKGSHYYGAQWWVGKDREWYSAQGYGGQVIAVFPQDDITMVMTSRNNDDNSTFGFSALREFYLKLKDQPNENPSAYAALQAKIQQLATPTATSKLRSPLEKTIHNRKIDLESPTFWANQLKFEFNDDTVTITMSPRSLSEQPFVIQANLSEAWLHTPVKPVDNRWQKSGPESMRAARAQWLDNNTLEFMAMDVDESYSVNYKIKFKGKKATLLNMNDSIASQGTLR
ncbi:serine hydrolase domain-containing protein [Deefgea piscis]|uniref:serine hydrolase domain-containing protein n=1 Tax=Deefgea piscis TaxID=2739061 RepID=UPI001C7F7E1D|nr:serine hydrolase [Deefgea piscis]QZA79916.1 beta-lactamase family protein [Deefgea piscis]